MVVAMRVQVVVRVYRISQNYTPYFTGVKWSMWTCNLRAIPKFTACRCFVQLLHGLNMIGILLCCSCNVCRTAVLIMYVLQKHERDTCGSCKTSGTDHRLSYNFHLYITCRTWTANIPLHSVKCFRLSESAVNRKESATIDTLWWEYIFFSVCSNSIYRISASLS
jgi:hypothetical protein